MTDEPASSVLEPKPDVHVYLDSNVIIDFGAGLVEHWDPVDEMTHKSNVQRINAVRLVFYGYSGRTPPGADAPWYLVTSARARMELERKTDHGDLITALSSEVDETLDSPPREVVEATAQRRSELTRITDMDDAFHLAEAGLRPWIRYVVTSDEEFRRRAEAY